MKDVLLNVAFGLVIFGALIFALGVALFFLSRSYDREVDRIVERIKEKK